MGHYPPSKREVAQWLKEWTEKQFAIHGVVVPNGTLCETCQGKGQYYAGTLIGYVNCPDCNE